MGGGDGSHFVYPRQPCGSGDMESWDDHRFTGGPRNAEGNLVVKMPRPAVLKRRRVVRVKATSHKRTTFNDTDDGEGVVEGTTNDVTRKVTVTFRRR